jgi:hypothetical protein
LDTGQRLNGFIGECQTGIPKLSEVDHEHLRKHRIGHLPACQRAGYGTNNCGGRTYACCSSRFYGCTGHAVRRIFGLKSMPWAEFVPNPLQIRRQAG